MHSNRGVLDIRISARRHVFIMCCTCFISLDVKLLRFIVKSGKRRMGREGALEVSLCLLHTHQHTHPKRAPGQLRGAGPMLAGIVDKAYRTPTVPGEREYKGLIVYVCVCMCAATRALLYCLQYFLAVCSLSACL